MLKIDDERVKRVSSYFQQALSSEASDSYILG